MTTAALPIDASMGTAAMIQYAGSDDPELFPSPAVGGAAGAGPGGLPMLAERFGDAHKIDLSRLSPPERRRLGEIVARHPHLDSATVLSFGAEPQRQANSFLDELLQGIATGDTGAAGDLTIALARNIRRINLEGMKRELKGQDWVAGTLGRLPLAGSWVSALRYFQLQHRAIVAHLGEIEAKAQTEMLRLQEANGRLDQLVLNTQRSLRELELHLAAGQSILLRARARFAQERETAQTGRDLAANARLRDWSEQIDAFESRLLRIHVALTDALISIPQIRQTQEAARISMRQILDTVLFDLPRLKSAILRVAALGQIQRASRDNDERRRLARSIGAIGAEAADAAYHEAKQADAGADEDIAILAASAERLLATIARGAEVDAQHRTQRAAARTRLDAVRQRLVEGLRNQLLNPPKHRA